MKRKLFVTIFFFSVLSLSAFAQIERIEPPNWWTEMRNPDLQIMIYGDIFIQRIL
jgi:hypothetical protein